MSKETRTKPYMTMSDNEVVKHVNECISRGFDATLESQLGKIEDMNESDLYLEGSTNRRNSISLLVNTFEMPTMLAKEVLYTCRGRLAQVILLDDLARAVLVTRARLKKQMNNIYMSAL